MAIQVRDELTSREYQIYEHDKEMFGLQADHSMRLKEADIKLAELEAKWRSWLRLPSLVIMLPVKVVMAFAYIVYAIRGKEPGEKFWETMK